jgi:predicted transposase YdaD
MSDASEASGRPSRRRRSRGAGGQAGSAPSAGRLVDGFAKQLVALAPNFWVEWATGRADLRPGEPLDPEFRLVFRQTDSLLPVTDPAGGEFNILFEFQLIPDDGMPYRVNAYSSVGEERYRRPVYPVVVNFQPTPTPTPTVYESECLGLRVRREFKVINLWEVPAERAFEPGATSLLALLPFLDGGEQPSLQERALAELRRHERAPELELFLLYLVQKVGGEEALQRLGARLDMAMLRATNWFQEIIEEGLAVGRQQGVQQGLQEAILRILGQRFGAVPPEIAAALSKRTEDELRALMTAALTVALLEEFRQRLSQP